MKYAILLLVLLIAVSTSLASAACSDSEYITVFTFQNIWPSFSPEIDIMAVSEVGPATYPQEIDVRAILYSLWGEGINPVTTPRDPVGNIWPWSSPDGMTLVDLRDGAILFAGSEQWMGFGSILHPLLSTHDWTLVGGVIAAAPSSTDVVVHNWGGGLPSTSELSESAVAMLRTTDVIHSYAACGEYTVTGYVYTPTIGGVDPSVAQLIVIVDGRVGAPWNGQPVAAESSSWGELKAQYR